MEATFGLTAVRPENNDGLVLFPSSSSSSTTVSFALEDKTDDDDDDWSTEDGCATETNPLLLLLLPDDDDEDDAPSLDLDEHARVLGRERPLVQSTLTRRCWSTQIEPKTSGPNVTTTVGGVVAVSILCAVGESERIERDVVIGTYFCDDFCARRHHHHQQRETTTIQATTIRPSRLFARLFQKLLGFDFHGVDVVFDDDEEASFSSSSSNTPFRSRLSSRTSRTSSRSSREGSSSTSTRASSSAVFTAEDKSTTSFFHLCRQRPLSSSLLSSTGTFDVSFSPMEEEEEEDASL